MYEDFKMESYSYVSSDGCFLVIEMPYAPLQHLDYINSDTDNLDAAALLALKRYIRSLYRDQEKKYMSDGYNSLEDGGLKFMLYNKLEITKDFHTNVNKTANKSPLRFTVRLKNFSRSRLQVESSLESINGGKLLVTRDTSMVYVDKTTRKSAPLPSWFINKYKHLQSSQPASPGYRRMELPTTTLTMSYVVTQDDIDWNGHVGDFVYPRECQRALRHYINNTTLQWFKPSTGAYLTKTVNILYARECHIGDKLIIYLWEDKSIPRLVHFHILKDDNLVVQCSLGFFPADDSKL